MVDKMDYKILETIEKNIEKGNVCALVTITESKGSTPRKVGSLMAVFSESIEGTIGGGTVEYEVIKEARKLMKTGEDKEFSYGMSPNDPLKLACGGSVRGFIKIFKPSNRLVVIGAGHIARELTYIAKRLDFDIDIIDDRADYAELNGIKVHTGDIIKHIKNLGTLENAYVVIASRGHMLDAVALREFIKMNVKYIGMVGSKAKVIQVTNELIDEGAKVEEFDNVYAPIGLKFSNGTPEEIALEILSEILAIKNNKEANHRRIKIGEYNKK